MQSVGIADVTARFASAGKRKPVDEILEPRFAGFELERAPCAEGLVRLDLDVVTLIWDQFVVAAVLVVVV